MTRYLQTSGNAACVLCAIILVWIVAPAQAQNTAGVPGPLVNDDHSSLQYRVTFDPDSNGLAQRIHYESSRDTSNMWRVVVQGRKTNERDVDFDFVQAEWFWQISPDGQKWKHGMRFDALIRSDGRPGLVGAHWLAEVALNPRWLARINVFNTVDIGDGAIDGVVIQTRGLLGYRADNDTVLGMEMYNIYGSTAKFNDFDDQLHQIGPFMTRNFGDGWQLFAGALFGASDVSPDHNLRLWLTRNY